MDLLAESEFRKIETMQTMAAVVFRGSFVLLVAMALLGSALPGLFLGE